MLDRMCSESFCGSCGAWYGLVHPSMRIQRVLLRLIVFAYGLFIRRPYRRALPCCQSKPALYDTRHRGKVITLVCPTCHKAIEGLVKPGENLPKDAQVTVRNLPIRSCRLWFKKKIGPLAPYKQLPP